jgi:hypothetical protein
MEDLFRNTENTFPLYKAYKVYEDAAQDFDNRINQFEGTSNPFLNPAFRSNGFIDYQQSGGISNNHAIL